MKFPKIKRISYFHFSFVDRSVSGLCENNWMDSLSACSISDGCPVQTNTGDGDGQVFGLVIHKAPSRHSHVALTWAPSGKRKTIKTKRNMEKSSGKRTHLERISIVGRSCSRGQEKGHWGNSFLAVPPPGGKELNYIPDQWKVIFAHADYLWELWISFARSDTLVQKKKMASFFA